MVTPWLLFEPHWLLLILKYLRVRRDNANFTERFKGQKWPRRPEELPELPQGLHEAGDVMGTVLPYDF